jgi:hypothetical protein
MFEIGDVSGAEVVGTHHPVIPSKKRVAKMRSEKPGSTCHQDAIGLSGICVMQSWEISRCDCVFRLSTCDQRLLILAQQVRDSRAVTHLSIGADGAL